MTARKKVTPKASKRLPPVPRIMNLPAGDVQVVRQSGLQARGCAGLFHWSERRITLDADLKLTAAWLTLYHEWVHAVLADAGVTDLKNSQEESVCNAIAHALVYGKRQP